jgi:hypothetical protein
VARCTRPLPCNVASKLASALRALALKLPLKRLQWQGWFCGGGGGGGRGGGEGVHLHAC